MSPTLHIRLFGAFVLTFQGEVQRDFHSSRLQSLLAYLVLHPATPHTRQQLAYLFWPESTESQARSNLRKLLFQLRSALPLADQFLRFDEYSVQWNVNSNYAADVAEIDELLTLASQRPLSRAENVRLLELVQGELLPNCYDDWVLPLRQKYQAGVRRCLEQLITQLENLRAYEEGIHYAQLLLDLDPLEERTYQQLMRLRLLRGDRAGAIRTYQECLAILQRELGVEPSVTTHQTYEQIMRQSEVDAGGKPYQETDTSILVARTEEWELLQQRWRQTQQGRPYAVILAGEAGIGKTRLAEELLLWASRQGILAAATRSYAAQGALAYTPIIELLRTPALRSRLSKLKPVWLVELSRLLPELAEMHPNLPAPEPLTDRLQRHRLYEALAQAIAVDNQPLLLFFDDLQWCDQESLEWLQFLFTNQRTLRLLLVGGLRSGEVDDSHPLHALRHALYHNDCLTECELTPMTLDEVASLAEQVAGASLDSSQTASLYQDSEGNPLFVVELVRAMVESKGDFLATTELESESARKPSVLPPKVAAVIQARLAQLSPLERELMGVAAAIGHSFSFAVLLEASALSEEGVVESLDELCRRRIVKEQAGDLFDFSHDRIRDVAYQQQSRMRRRLLHRRIGAALTKVYAERIDSVIGELAHHAEQAGELEHAVSYLQRAAQVSQSVVAYSEAVSYLRKALAILPSLPLSPNAALQQELALLAPLGAALIPLRGYANPEVEAVYKRAHELCEQSEDAPYLMPVLVGLSLFYLLHGELRRGLATGQHFLQLAQSTQDEGIVLEAHGVVGPILMYLGRFQEAARHLEAALALYDPERHGDHAAMYGQDPGVACLACLCTTLWQLGQLDRSLKALQDAVTLAQKLSHQYSLAFAYTFVAHLHHLRKQPAEVQTFGKVSVEHSGRYGFPYWLATSTMLHGWGKVWSGVSANENMAQTEKVLDEMLEAFAGFKQSGVGLFRGYYRSMIVEAHMAIGSRDAAVAGLEEAFVMMDATDDRFWAAEMHRLRGDLLLAEEGVRSSHERERNAEAAYLQAIQLAHEQEGRTLELRAATSLGQLWMRQGQRQRAYELLRPLVEWFTEGFDTPDLQNATTLLASLA